MGRLETAQVLDYAEAEHTLHMGSHDRSYALAAQRSLVSGMASTAVVEGHTSTFAAGIAVVVAPAFSEQHMLVGHRGSDRRRLQLERAYPAFRRALLRSGQQ